MAHEERIAKLEKWVQDAKARNLVARVEKLESDQSILSILVERLVAFLPFGK